jgi:hypothetical protein
MEGAAASKWRQRTKAEVSAAARDVPKVRPAIAAGRAVVVVAAVAGSTAVVAAAGSTVAVAAASAEVVVAVVGGADCRMSTDLSHRTQRMPNRQGVHVTSHSNRVSKQLQQCRRIGALAAILLSFALTDATGSTAPPDAKVFKSPQAAVDALLAVAAQNQTGDLLAILGSAGKDVVFSGDETADRAGREAFLAASKEKTALVTTSKASVVLKVGADEWPFPIPIVKGAKGWFFDTAAGKQELISRRIGRNELRAIALCQAFVTAEREYAQTGQNGATPGVYAQRLLSSEGKHDGLYWVAKAGEPESPLGPLAAEAAVEGYEAKPSASGPKPFHGYFFKIMTAQGANAPAGAQDYVADGKMTGGFALVAWPAEYGVSGIMTFVVNQTGIVFEKNLGPKTADGAKVMDQFNPDLTWKPSKL